MEDKYKEEKTDKYIIIVIGKKCNEARSSKPTQSTAPKSKGAGKKKHTSTKEKIKEITKRPSPKADPLMFKETG